jgi:hypothetical protein
MEKGQRDVTHAQMSYLHIRATPGWRVVRFPDGQSTLSPNFSAAPPPSGENHIQCESSNLLIGLGRMGGTIAHRELLRLCQSQALSLLAKEIQSFPEVNTGNKEREEQEIILQSLPYTAEPPSMSLKTFSPWKRISSRTTNPKLVYQTFRSDIV